MVYKQKHIVKMEKIIYLSVYLSIQTHQLRYKTTYFIKEKERKRKNVHIFELLFFLVMSHLRFAGPCTAGR